MNVHPDPVRSLEARYYTDPDIYVAEQKGLLARKTGAIEGDRRGVLVELTRRGRVAVRSMSDAMAAARKDADELAQQLAETLNGP